ncbi:hypothetical protein jaqu_13790 [Jannaschia aquimarina]|uniref:DUF4123 domain-containing protein n=2 Tax=Jannaschia aquimarina TaxID=935700 RepID=A0A0D1EIY5_9RHOB|nr:DUF4123 domain-containing protein [Jannaschia aquimarina]KIT16881.1 hypothetical protein jaqu_13790 [Jannaschia aquimarina]SNT12441.1 protein of unknown function [Jannaschia aquimarina]
MSIPASAFVTPAPVWACRVTVRDSAGVAYSGLGLARATRAHLGLRALLRQAESERGGEAEGEVIAEASEAPLDEIVTLAASLTDGQDVLLGPLGLDEPARAANLAGLTGGFDREELADVSPFDARTEDRSCPASLRDVLFPETPDRVGAAEDHTYAVLDAARVFGLADRIAASGLDHACLFQGEAARVHADSAPYVVRLMPGNGFVRALFSAFPDDDLHAGLWPSQPGIFVRTPLSLKGLRAQMRRFTMVRDSATGRRIYFRFYEPTTFRTLIANSEPGVLSQFARGCRLFVAPGPRNGATILRRRREGPASSGSSTPASL